MKKGFTLIELLAVIVVLAVIALIAVPMILGVIEESKLGAFKDSVSLTFSSAELYEAKNTISESGIEVKDLSLKNNNFKYGKIIKNANNELEAVNVSDGYYCANGVLTNLSINKGECDSSTPTCTYEITSGTKGLNDFYITSPTIEFKTSKSNVSGLYYGVGFEENYEVSVLKENESKTLTSIITTSVNTTTIYGYVKSGSGKKNTCSVTFKTDLTAPSSPEVSGTNIIWTTSKTLTLTEPISRSGILKYEYYISETNTKPLDNVTVTGFTNSLVNEINTSGKYIYFRSVNNAGVTGSWSDAKDLFVDSVNPTVNLTETFYDKDTGLVNASLIRNDWVKKASVLIKASDATSGIKELKYKIDNGTWTIVSGTETTVTLENLGKTKLYVSTTDNSNNAFEQVYDYNTYTTDNYEIWLLKAGINTAYSTIADLFNDTTVLNTLMSNASALSYMYASTSTLLDSITANTNAVTSLTNSKTALQSLRTSSLWINKYRTTQAFLDKLLSTTVLTNVEKYNLGLPFYLYNGATTGVSNFTSFYKVYFGAPTGNSGTTAGNIYISLTSTPGACALQRLGTSSLINFTNYKYMSSYAVSVLQQDPGAGIWMGLSNTIPSTENSLFHYTGLVTGNNKLDLLTYNSSYYVTFSIGSCYTGSTMYSNSATVSKLWIY